MRNSWEGLELIDRVQDTLDRDLTRDWIEALRSYDDDWHAQAFGELMVLRAWRCRDDPWPRAELNAILAVECPCGERAAVHRGVALMIVRLLRDGHEFTESLSWLTSLATWEDEKISRVLHDAVWRFREAPTCATGECLLEIFARTPFHLGHGHSHNLVRMLSVYLDDYPDLVADVCEKLLEATKGLTMDPRELLRLILAVEARDDQIEAGLRMFERACDLDVYGTHELLRPQ